MKVYFAKSIKITVSIFAVNIILSVLDICYSDSIK